MYKSVSIMLLIYMSRIVYSFERSEYGYTCIYLRKCNRILKHKHYAI